jgi:Carboxypeptidase regulatory-like domain
MSCSDRTPRDRPKASRLALWVALILVALLTSCSTGQPVRGFSGWSAIEVQGAEHYALDTTHETSEPTAQPPEDGTNTGTGDTAVLDDSVISGHAYDAAGEALAGVNIYIRAVPESSGEPYQTTTDADGAYSYSVPDGVYLISAEYNSDGDSGGAVYLEPTNGDGSVTVPPSARVDFKLTSGQ